MPCPAACPRSFVRLLLLCLPSACVGDVRSGDTVILKANTGTHLEVDREGRVRARPSAEREAQKFVIEAMSPGSIRSGGTVFLRGSFGSYIDVNATRVEAKWPDRGHWQRLRIESAETHGAVQNGDMVYFRTHTGMYIDVEGEEVQARWPDQGDWQAFHLEDLDEAGGSSDLFHGALDIIGTGCGFVNLPKGEPDIACNRAMETDCTSLHSLTRSCPPRCPFVAPHPQLSCVYQCTVAKNCSSANPEVAYANNLTSACEPCEVVGCRRCSSRSVCAECFNNFLPEFGGRACMYVWDERAKHGVAGVVWLLLVVALLATIVLILADYCACCGRCLPHESPDDKLDEDSEGESPHAEGELPSLEESATTKAIRQGKQHRLRCKIKHFETSGDWAEDSPKAHLKQSDKPWRFDQFELWTNLRSEFLTGVGLPLFHQWYYFLFFYSLLMTAGTFWVYRYSELGGVLQKNALEHASDVFNGADMMAKCGLRARNSDQLGDSVRDFARRAATVYFALWLLGFFLSVAHAVRQRRVATEFYREHPCLAEFTLNVEGFPPEATDEIRIRNFLREAFSTQGLEVSVCYDYRSRRRRVHEMLEKILVHADVQASTYDSKLAAGQFGKRGMGLSEAEREEVRSWLADAGAPGNLRNAGHVFAIFPHHFDLQECKRKFEEELTVRQRRNVPDPPTLPHQDTPRWLPFAAKPLIWVGDDGKRHDLVIRDVVCEPPDVVWENHGTETCRLVLGHIGAASFIVVSFVALTTVIFYPLASYSINYMLQAGSFPTGVMMSVLGTLVMAANWVMCFVHGQSSALVGFVRRDREGLVIVKVFSLLCLLNFVFNVSISLFPESQANPLDYMTHPLDSGLITEDSISFQARVSSQVFHVLVPGSLFFGYFIWPLQGFVWPFVSTLAFLRCKYRRSRFVPAREVENALQPLGLSLPNDYMGTIVQPTSCSLVLFFASDIAWQTFACLVCWSLFMVFFMRYLHLRAVRRCYCTTNRLDTDVLIMWGVPLSMVLAASVFWAARLRGWHLWVVPAAWVAGSALYVCVLTNCVRPLIPPKSEGACHRPSYNEVRSRRFYDWHNCNPIKVLLSHCLDGHGCPLTPFETGKEYLQVHAQTLTGRRKSVGQDARWSSLRAPSSWISKNFHIPEVEALINGPLDAIGALAPPRSRVSQAGTPKTANNKRGESPLSPLIGSDDDPSQGGLSPASPPFSSSSPAPPAPPALSPKATASDGDCWWPSDSGGTGADARVPRSPGDQDPWPVDFEPL